MSLVSYLIFGEELIDLIKLITYRNGRGRYCPPKGKNFSLSCRNQYGLYVGYSREK